MKLPLHPVDLLRVPSPFRSCNGPIKPPEETSGCSSRGNRDSDQGPDFVTE